MGLLKLGFWMVLIFVGLVAGMYIEGGGEIEGAPVFDDPSREQVDGDVIKWIELREDGVYAGTEVTGFGGFGSDVFVTLPNGDTHKMFEERRDDVDDAIVYSYDVEGAPTGNYTVEKVSYSVSGQGDEVDESHTVYLESPT